MIPFRDARVDRDTRDARAADVVVLPGVMRPMALGFKSDEIHRLLTMAAEGVL